METRIDIVQDAQLKIIFGRLLSTDVMYYSGWLLPSSASSERNSLEVFNFVNSLI